MIKLSRVTHLLALLLLASANALASPVIENWKTDKGLRVYFVQAPEIPMLDLQLVFDAGSARDLDLPGLATLTKNMLDEGSGTWDADTIASRFEDVGARYSAGAQRDMAWASLRSLNDPELLEPALETFIKVVASPSFPQKDYERVKKNLLVYLQAQDQRPGEIAEKAFYRSIYGDHPFATPISGTKESVATITHQKVIDFHHRHYVARNGLLAIVGDIDRHQAVKLAQRISNNLVEGKAMPPLPEVKPLTQAKKIRVPFPSAQAHVYIGQPGIRRGDPDYFPLYLGNHVLGGGGFSSRLVKEVRVNRGLSYSVYSYFVPQMVKGPFQIGLQTRVDQADQAAALAKRTLRDFINKGPSDKELEASIKNITGGFPLRIDSNSEIVSYLAVIGFYELPLDYLETFNDKVKTVNRDAVTDAFKRRVQADNMVTIIVGGQSETS